MKRSALVNIRRKALLSSVGFRKRMRSRSPRSWMCWFICTSIVYIRDFVPLFRIFLDWFQSIQTRRCHCLRLKDVLMFQASSYSAGKRTFQWMLLNNILWMALDHQAVYLGDNYTLPLSSLNTCIYSVKIAILIFHTWGEGSILLFIIPLLCYLPYKVKRMRKIWGGNNDII